MLTWRSLTLRPGNGLGNGRRGSHPLRVGAALVALGALLNLVAVANAVWSGMGHGESPLDSAAYSGAGGEGFVPYFAPESLPGIGVATSPVAFGEAVVGDPGQGPAPTVWLPDRITIPVIELDAPVIVADFKEVTVDDKIYRQWVAPDMFAAGWHRTSALLGEPANTVLNGHHNAFGEVFRRLVDLQAGDVILVYSGERRFAYAVAQRMILAERGQPLDVRLANAQWIQPSSDERLTLVTCWPYTSNTHRLILVAMPVELSADQLAQITPRAAMSGPAPFLGPTPTPPTLDTATPKPAPTTDPNPPPESPAVGAPTTGPGPEVIPTEIPPPTDIPTVLPLPSDTPAPTPTPEPPPGDTPPPPTDVPPEPSVMPAP